MFREPDFRLTAACALTVSHIFREVRGMSTPDLLSFQKEKRHIRYMNRLIEILPHLLEEGRTAAVTVAVARVGSAPTPAEACLIVTSDSVRGTLGGGQVEAEMILRSRAAIADGIARLSEFSFDSDTVRPQSMLCGGRITFFTYLARPSMDSRKFWSAAAALSGRGGRAWLVTAVLEGGAGGAESWHLLVESGRAVAGRLPERAWEEAVTGQLSGVEDFRDTVFIKPEKSPAAWPGLAGFLVEPLQPEPSLLICGGGHIGLALCRVAALAGFRVTVADDRPEYSAPERFPDAERVIKGTFAEVFEILSPGTGWCVVSVARCHDQDRAVVELALDRPVDYIGMIGSRRKVKMIREHLEAQGITSERLDSIHAPVGLEIGAQTPEEIAISITAQLIQVRRSRKPTIHREIISL